jgi:WXXGXW repeat (2 copies)
MRKKFLAGAVVLFGTILAACGGYGGYGGGYYVRYAPPAPRYEAVGIAPGPGFVWTNGYWDWRGNNWYWVGGRWMRPPHRGRVWVAPEWRYEGRGYRFHRGYWR